MKTICLGCLVGLLSISCGSSGGSTASTNQFSTSGSQMTITDLATTTSGGTTTEVVDYVGVIGILSSSLLYSASVKFKVNKQSDTQAYFSNVTVEHCTKISHDGTLTGSSSLISTSTDLSVTSAFSATTNSITIEDASLRYVDFVLAFGNANPSSCPIPASITGVGVCTTDFSTCAGGDDASYIFIFQKGTSLSTCSASDITGSWKALNFDVSSSDFSSVSTSTVTVGAVADSTATFTGEDSVSGAFAGTVGLNDANTCGYLFTYDQSTHALGGSIDGAFLMAPSAAKDLVLGYDFESGRYFAISP
jgi:hypothetical protein